MDRTGMPVQVNDVITGGLAAIASLSHTVAQQEVKHLLKYVL
jgi:hypothetical protein